MSWRWQEAAADGSFDLIASPGVPILKPLPPPPAPREYMPDDGGEAVWGAAFRQTNSVISLIRYLRNAGRYAPEPGYNPINDIEKWGDKDYFLNHGTAFVGSQSSAETQQIKANIDQETADKRILQANGMIGFIAMAAAGMLDPTMLMPGGVVVDTVRGGLSFTKTQISGSLGQT